LRYAIAIFEAAAPAPASAVCELSFIAMTIASVRFEDPEARELLIRGAAIVWRHTERFKSGEEAMIN